MKRISLLLCLLSSGLILAQNHTKKPIRFIFESIHDHLGTIELNSKRVKLFSPDNKLLYEADIYAGKELDEEFFFYDASGKLLRNHRNFHQEHESGDFRMTYDAKGNLIAETNLDDRGQTLELISMTYDAKGNMLTRKVEFLHKTENKMITESSFDYTYDAAGKIASRKGWEDEKSDKIVTYKYVYEANSESISRYDAASVLKEKWVKKTDEKGRLLADIHSTYEPGMAPVSKTIDFIYDEHDHILTETMSQSNSTVKKQVSFEYVYDAFGNWTERKEKITVGVKASEGVFLKRSIEYYENITYTHPPMELDESYVWEKQEGKDVKIFEESHVRINNNAGELEWVVRRNGQTLFQVDEYEYTNKKLAQINHLILLETGPARTDAKYDDKGLLSELVSLTAGSEIEARTRYMYDDKGQVIRSEEEMREGPNTPLATAVIEEYKYDASGKLIKESVEDYGVKSTIDYEYDATGNLLKEVETAEDGNITTTYVFEAGKRISKTQISGKAEDKTTYEYDTRGELIKSKSYQAGVLVSEIGYAYFE